MSFPQPVIQYTSSAPGPHVLALGAIHGHEPCGAYAITRLRAELDAGVVQLQAGTLTLMPICNPLAYSRQQRYVVQDLNRIITRHAHPQNDEQRYANKVADQIDLCDVVLDMHSATTGSGPSLFLDYPYPENIAHATALGIGHWVAGWNELYADQPDLSAGDTTSYAHARGKRGLCVECGQHDEPAIAHTAYDILRRSLAHHGLMAYDVAPLAARTPQVALMRHIVRRDRPGRFAMPWQHLQPVAAGTVLVEYDDGAVLRAETNSILVLPRPYAKPGQEWLYIAEQVDIDALAAMRA